MNSKKITCKLHQILHSNNRPKTWNFYLAQLVILILVWLLIDLSLQVKALLPNTCINTPFLTCEILQKNTHIHSMLRASEE